MCNRIFSCPDAVSCVVQSSAMGILSTIKKPPWRTFFAVGVVLLAGLLGYAVWSPGEDVRDGRHDLGRNGVYLQHAWLGDDAWFEQNRTGHGADHFRSIDAVRRLAKRLREHHITDVFPHLCPTDRVGRIAGYDAEQTERLLDAMDGFRVMPWVGGVRNKQAFPGEARWRGRFAKSIAEMLRAHPRLAGVHVNIEPCRSGSEDLLATLDAVRAAMPPGKVLSLAAYPPPTVWQRVEEVHWAEAYYRQVAKRVDQIVVMMYDTALSYEKPYRRLLADWTEEVLQWSRPAEILLAVPTYDDADTDYHDPRVENLTNAVLGVHAGLGRGDGLAANYRGVAIYCEWQTDEDEWRLFRERFLKGERPR